MCRGKNDFSYVLAATKRLTSDIDCSFLKMCSSLQIDIALYKKSAVQYM